MEDILVNSPLFAGLRATEIGSLISMVHHQVRTYGQEEVVVHGGDNCTAMQVVLEGSVRGEMMNMAGKILKIEDIGPAKPLAIAFLFGQDNRYPVTVTANEDVKILVLPKASVIKMMQRSELFLSNFLNAISNRAQFISDKLKFLSFQGLRGKVALYLLENDWQHTGRVFLAKTHDELASIFGVARPSLSRVLSDLHQEGVIEVRGKNIRILNRELLKNCLSK